MVSWGPVRADGERFYTGQKNAPPWVRDLNWKHRCRLENEGLEAKRKREKEERLRRAMGISDPRRGGATSSRRQAKGVRMKMGSLGAMVPDEPEEKLLERLAFAVESKKRALTRPAGKDTARTESSARSYRSGSSARSRPRTGRSSTGSISTIGTVNTEIRDLIRETASKEIEELRRALQLETTLRAESDKKIDKLVSELEKLRQSK